MTFCWFCGKNGYKKSSAPSRKSGTKTHKRKRFSAVPPAFPVIKNRRALNIAFNGATRFCLIGKIFSAKPLAGELRKNFIRGKTFSPMVFPLFSEK
jgi:hypothetical protein